MGLLTSFLTVFSSYTNIQEVSFTWKHCIAVEALTTLWELPKINNALLDFALIFCLQDYLGLRGLAVLLSEPANQITMTLIKKFLLLTIAIR